MFDSRWVLTGLGRPGCDAGFAVGSRRSGLGRAPSRDGREDDGCLAWPGCDWNEGILGIAPGREDAESDLC